MDVLIVDDSLLAEHAIKSYFTRLDLNVVGLAKTGNIGKEKFVELQPDLVTIDAVMPGMPGRELVKFINDYDKQNGKTTKVFMITSSTITDEDKTNMKVDAYIIKPITLNKIKIALSEL